MANLSKEPTTFLSAGGREQPSTFDLRAETVLLGNCSRGESMAATSSFRWSGEEPIARRTVAPHHRPIACSCTYYFGTRCHQQIKWKEKSVRWRCFFWTHGMKHDHGRHTTGMLLLYTVYSLIPPPPKPNNAAHSGRRSACSG